jgi:hypothetical protein
LSASGGLYRGQAKGNEAKERKAVNRGDLND